MLRIKGLGDLEADIMDRLWSHGAPVTVRQVLDVLLVDRALAYTTVMTVMDNLHRKEWLVREMTGRAWVYRPASTREQYSAVLMEQALAHSSDQVATLVHFVDLMSDSDGDALRQALKTARARDTRARNETSRQAR